MKSIRRWGGEFLASESNIFQKNPILFDEFCLCYIVFVMRRYTITGMIAMR